MGSSCGKSSSLPQQWVLKSSMFIVYILLFTAFTSSTVLADEANHHHHHHHHPLNRSRHLHNKMSTYSNKSSSGSLAIFVFGDSTVDPGNNNYINTAAKSNFPPYGRDLIPNHMPTGRFTNGMLIPDFIASYLGIKELVPPYLDPTLNFQELMTGVSFASSASGYDPLTSKLTGAIPMLKQLDYFLEYKTRLEAVIGKKKTEDHIQNAVFIISAGTNDFVLNYYLGVIPIRRLTFTLIEYQNFVMKNTLDFLQGLWDLGARRIVMVGLPSIGCLPIVITFKSNSNNILKQDCVDTYSKVARDYNKKLEDELVSIQQRFSKYKGLIVYADIYNPLEDIIANYKKLGFEEWRSGCCGTGLYEVSVFCNPSSLVCHDASKYVFWDSIHPSEKTYYIVFIIAFRNFLDIMFAH